jgi:hypothetical protein
MRTSRIQAWYQNSKKHLILAQFSISPWTCGSRRSSGVRLVGRFPGRVFQRLQPSQLRLPPNNSLTDPLFGHSTETLASSLGSGGANGGFNPLYQIGGPRSIQLAPEARVLNALCAFVTGHDFSHAVSCQSQSKPRRALAVSLRIRTCRVRLR